MEKRQAEDLVSTIESAYNEEQLKIALGLEEIECMNSSGLNIILGLFPSTRNTRGELVIGGVREKCDTF